MPSLNQQFGLNFGFPVRATGEVAKSFLLPGFPEKRPNFGLLF